MVIFAEPEPYYSSHASSDPVVDTTKLMMILPSRRLRDPHMRTLAVGAGNSEFAAALSARIGVGGERAPPGWTGPRLVHSIHEDGPKVIEMTDAEELAFRVSNPDVRVLPLAYYELARLPKIDINQTAETAAAGLSIPLRLTVVRSTDGVPVHGAEVIAFTDFANTRGAKADADANGMVELDLGATSLKLDALLIYPPAGYWGHFERDYMALTGARVLLDPLDLTQPDYLAPICAPRPRTAGVGVKVGVIDTGVAPTHPDLVVAGGECFVRRENDAGGLGPATYTDGDHGTHVAGIIASRGQAPAGKRGVAPGVTLMSYRVFGNDGAGAENYDIVRAIDRAVEDGCDFINLSLQIRTVEESVHDAIKDAFDAGTVCIAAAGNDGRQPVAYPAKWPESVAVSAVGRKGTFPLDSAETVDVLAPFSTIDPQVFLARFSNLGPEISFAAPGVGIVSTVPPGYAAMSGTSMSCPAVTGVAAALLEQNPAIRNMPRSHGRSTAIVQMLRTAAQPIGFARDIEGFGAVS